MKPILLAVAAASLAAPALAQGARGLDAHVHGVTKAEIAVEHGAVEISLHAPGMDIVGFEYAASSGEEKDAVAAAMRQFLVPEEIVALPEEAGCRLTDVRAHLQSGGHEEDHGGEHDHAEHGHDDHGHDDHGHEEHGHGEHGGHGDHAENGHAEHAKEEGGKHSEFHARYAFACENEDALTAIAFPFFERFENAQEIAVQYVTETGAGTAELTRAAPELALE